MGKSLNLRFPPLHFSRSYDVQIEVIQLAAFLRNISVKRYSRLIYTLAYQGKTVAFHMGMPQVVSQVSRAASNNKFVAKQLLTEQGLNVPRGRVFEADGKSEALRCFKSLDAPAVVKPLFGSGGKGVSVELVSEQDFYSAWDFALEQKPKQIIVEEYIKGKDCRVLVIGSQVTAAALRIPLNVTGDGVSSIVDLVDKKNNERKVNPYLGSKEIVVNANICHYLESQGLNLDSILSEGQQVGLSKVANIGTGGESEDITEIIHPGFAEIAIRAKEALWGVSHVGIDLLTEDISRSPESQCWAICEVNTNPDLALHHFPSYGLARDAAGQLIEHLFPDANLENAQKSRTSETFSLSIKVEQESFVALLEKQAFLRGMTLQLDLSNKGKLEVCYFGTQSACKSYARYLTSLTEGFG